MRKLLMHLGAAIVIGVGLAFVFNLEPIWWLAWVLPGLLFALALRTEGWASRGLVALAVLIGVASNFPYLRSVMPLVPAVIVTLLLGGVGLASFAVIRDPQWLLASMVGVGFAWASILSLPYALLAGSVPSRKMGVYMGIFNFFIVIPQLVAATVLGTALKHLLGGEPVYILVVGGVSFALAGALALRVK